MIKKRSVRFGSYDTAAHGWTLTGWKLSDPEQKTNYIEKAGGDGSWDLSTVLTDGVPRYKDRTLTVTLECSEGTRADRELLVSHLVNLLDGLEWRIVPPDHPGHYLTGRLHVAVDQNTHAFAKVTVSGTCAPWLYSAKETSYKLAATPATQTITLRNNGRRAIVPELTVTGSVRVAYGAASLQMGAGTYEWPTLLLTSGSHVLEYTGAGTLIITYREAVLR